MEHHIIHSLVKPIHRLIEVIWYVFYIIQTLLLLKLLLRLIGANIGAPFTRFIYNSTEPLMQPFQYMVSPWPFPPGVLDWNILIAMLIYWMIVWIIVEILLIATPPVTTTYIHKIPDQH